MTSLQKAARPLLTSPLRPPFLPTLPLARRLTAPLLRSTYATHSSTTPPPNPSSRKSITITSDDGRVRWTDLSPREKAARTTQQSFNFLIVILGVVATGFVASVLWGDVFSSSSKVSHFNRVVERIKSDARCVDVLGNPRKIRAFGDGSWNRWTRNRAIPSRVVKDAAGNEDLYMQFNVVGPAGEGRVHVHMRRRKGEGEFAYRELWLDPKGKSRIYLERADAAAVGEKKAPGKMFGVKWW
ncbi:mitochondrial import inner membrane translocase subunit tim21 [Coniosporium apollinis]|uniref:Mitochondrial import inner membrane translocase subunit Tim21 n=1 Tax=Coniosporium apollinis TaxID=61459 RepID=A0ABQ9P9Y9_9PEZI|nr:mitochondrial import inner membrane translocase subunit tim21 [Coniosporium apollinis]